MKKIFIEIDKLQEEIKTKRPLDKQLLMQIKEYFRIGLTYSSNSLEGNSLTESETKVVLEEGITIGGKPIKDHYEAIGHSEAYDHIYKIYNKKTISEEDIKTLHKIFYFRIDNENAGNYRIRKAFITGSKYPLPEPEEIPDLMEGLCIKLGKLRKKTHCVEFAAMAHKEFVFIHPFIDGNGRVARLLMNLILLQGGYTVAIIPPIMRQNYIQSLELAHKNDKDFIELIARAVKETQKDFLRIFNL